MPPTAKTTVFQRKSTRHDQHRPHIDYDDLREWLAHAERLGEVKIVRGATWHEDIRLAWNAMRMKAA